MWLVGAGEHAHDCGDIHKYHNADEPLGSSHQDLANPALSWPKRGVMDEGQGDLEKKLPLSTRVVKLAQDLGNIWTWLLVLSEHPLKGGVCTLSLGQLTIPYPGYKHHCCAKGHHISAPVQTHTCTQSLLARLCVSRETEVSLWKSRYRVRLWLHALAESVQAVTRGTVWPPGPVTVCSLLWERGTRRNRGGRTAGLLTGFILQHTHSLVTQHDGY